MIASEALKPPAISKQRIRATRRLLAPILLALAIRLLVVPFLISDTLNPARNHWKFGWEEGRIAKSIAAGEGFSSPLFGHTGPTAWTTPVYPYVLAAIFRVSETYTPAAAWVILGLNATFSALTCIPVYFIAQRTAGSAAASWATWIWALHPYAIYFSAGYVWDYCLDAFMLAVLLWSTIAIEREIKLRWWVGYGFLWGIAALTNAVILSTLPLLLAWLVWRRYHCGFRWRLDTAVAIFALVLTVTPWFLRNYVTFGRFIPFRDTFWMIFWEGNTGDLSELYPDWANPAHNDAEMEKYRRLGELGYIEGKRATSLHFLGQNPRLFAWLTVKRFIFTWTGYWSLKADYLAAEPMAVPNIIFCLIITVLALAGLLVSYRMNPAITAPSALVLLSYPLVYYVTHPGMEYKHAIDPVLTVFLGVAASSVAARRTQRTALVSANLQS